jgi:hypothetical protein
MFVLRCLGVSLSFFLLLYGVLSLLVIRSWRLAQRACRRLSAKRIANFLFALRTLPLAGALLISAVFVVPSFLLLEPRLSPSPVGEIPLTRDLPAASGRRTLNAISAHRKTSRAVRGWLLVRPPTRIATRFLCFAFVRLPALAVAGGLSPRVLLSDAPPQPRLPRPNSKRRSGHEIAHVERRDNLKNSCSVFYSARTLPAGIGLVRGPPRWPLTTRLYPIHGKLPRSRPPALIKLSRFALPQKSAVLAIGLVHASSSALNARIERLVAWDETRRDTSSGSLFAYLAPAFLGVCLFVIATYGVVLVDMHKMTEWLVR